MRPFGKVLSSVWRSRKFRALETDLERTAFFYVLTSGHGNSIGAFVMPPELAALEMKRDPGAIKSAFCRLAEVGLIRRDAEEEVVQVVGFMRTNAPTSRKHLAGVLTALDTLPRCDLKAWVAADVAVSIYERARGWGHDVDARGIFMDQAAKMIRARALEEIICHPDSDHEIDLLIGLSEDLLIDLPIQQRQEKQTREADRDTDSDIDTEAEAEADRDSGAAQRAKRAGKAVPPDVQDQIRALSEKAGPRKRKK